MRKISFFLFMGMLATSMAALSQEKTLLSENFTNNKNGWHLQKDSSFLVDIHKGALHLEKFRKNFDDRGCLWYRREISGLNTLQNFSIIFYAKFLSGGDIVDMIDIQWGTWDKIIASKVTSIYQLNFLLQGDVKLDYFNKGWDYSARSKAKEILDRNLYRPNQLNKYEIKQEDGFVIFYVNDQQYFKQFAKPIAGNSIGFQGCLKSAWEIDKIIVRQAKQPTKEESPRLPLQEEPIEINTKTTDGSLKVYPNPFINEFTVPVSVEKTTNARIEFINIKGNLMLEYDRKLEPGQHTIRLYADVPAGSYIVKLTVDNKVTTAKLVKQ